MNAESIPQEKTMHKKMIPFFFVPLLATTALASEQTGLAAPNNPLPSDVHGAVNEQMMGGAASNTQNTVEKALVTKEALAKTDKKFATYEEFTAYMPHVAEWHAKLNSVELRIPYDGQKAALSSLAVILTDIAKYAGLTSTLKVDLNNFMPTENMIEPFINQCFSVNPTLALLQISSYPGYFSDAFKTRMNSQHQGRIRFDNF